MKYVAFALPMLLGIEILSWMCLAVIGIVGLLDLAMKIDEEKNGRW